MIEIDGSQGEGGGQILRSSLALSMATGQGFVLRNIRARRPRPGLMRQHLTCVQAAATICGATVDGAEMESTGLTFKPGRVRGGDYHFAIGTAGGTMLVLQAVLPALLRAQERSRLVIEGGTHNVAAPPFEFFAMSLAPILARSGATIRTTLERHGFYPAGGGRVVVEIEPVATPRAIEVMWRDAPTTQAPAAAAEGTPPQAGREARPVRLSAVAMVSQLSGEIAQRELAVLRARLTIDEPDTKLQQIESPIGPGNAVLVCVQSAQLTEVFSAIGELRRSAEAVANGLANEVATYLAAGVPVGPYLADQLMVPMAVLGGGQFVTSALSPHSTTNIDTLAAFGITVKTQKPTERRHIISVPAVEVRR
ncbi:MAG: RNA 3'-terminal phosphate cyclase [Phycisphaerales bacterium]|jgi:RNA 3'-terminal phosphate cyclase (ATP)|nr:RNA 3'-terminal phosphate cyclase [Phycisphaerales bacterium]